LKEFILIEKGVYFGLLEALIDLDDSSLLEAQKARFTEVNGLLERSEYDESIYEDWTGASDALLDQLIKSKSKQDRLAILEKVFNDEDPLSEHSSLELLTHLRVKLFILLEEFCL
jgi:hypothetical protein